METKSTSTEVKPEIKPDVNPVKPEAPKEKKSNRKTGLLIFAFLSLAGNGVLGWLYWQEKNRADTVKVEKETVVVERDNVKADLVQLQEDYGTLQTSDKKIQGELEDKKSQIAQLIVEADKHKNDAYYISKLKKETETLRKIMQGYVRTIDSLGVANKTLLTENVKVHSQFLSEREKATQLNKEKTELQDVINTGAILKASGIKAMGVKEKSGGKKESETTKARKVDKIKTTFTIGENSLAKKGNREVYMRILTPDGKELARALDDANSFSFRGVRGFFCSRQSVNYDNKEVPVAMYAENKAGFIAGKYMIEIYCEQNLIAQTTLTLE